MSLEPSSIGPRGLPGSAAGFSGGPTRGKIPPSEERTRPWRPSAAEVSLPPFNERVRVSRVRIVAGQIVVFRRVHVSRPIGFAEVRGPRQAPPSGFSVEAQVEPPTGQPFSAVVHRLGRHPSSSFAAESHLLREPGTNVHASYRSSSATSR